MIYNQMDSIRDSCNVFVKSVPISILVQKNILQFRESKILRSATVSEFPKIVAMCFNQDSWNEIAQQIALCRKERSTDSNPVVQIQIQLQVLIHIRYYK